MSFLAENYFYLSRQSLKDIKVWPQTLNVLDLWEKQLEYYNTIRGLKLQTETLRTGWDMHLPENKKALLAEEKNPGTRFDKPSPFLSAVEFTQICDKIKHKAGVGGAKLFKPLRAAVLGRTQGPELKTIVPLLQIKVLLKRVVYVKNSLLNIKCKDNRVFFDFRDGMKKQFSKQGIKKDLFPAQSQKNLMWGVPY